ncbi:hypothetical protein GVAV_000978 [Gurleya vavrai]
MLKIIAVVLYSFFCANNIENTMINCKSMNEKLELLKYENTNKDTIFKFENRKTVLLLYEEKNADRILDVKAQKVYTNNLEAFIDFFYDELTLEERIYKTLACIDDNQNNYRNFSLYLSDNNQLFEVLNCLSKNNTIGTVIMFLNILMKIYPYSINQFLEINIEFFVHKVFRYVIFDSFTFFETITENEKDQHTNRFFREGTFFMEFKTIENFEFVFWRDPEKFDKRNFLLNFGFYRY